MNAPQPNRSDFKLGKSIHHIIPSESLFSSNEANLKLQPPSSSSPRGLVRPAPNRFLLFAPILPHSVPFISLTLHAKWHKLLPAR